jgi:arabinogalactan oligomer/maltooligosaccharide transport system substrate-binding protein
MLVMVSALWILVLAALPGARPVVAETTRITLWHSYRGDERTALEQVVSRFNSEQSELAVELLQVPYDAFADKISAAIPRGKGPDIFIFAHDRIGDWAESGVIEPIGFWAKEEVRKRFPEQALAALTYDDALYALPTAIKCTVLIYNKRLVSTPPGTTEELIALGKQLTDPEKGRFGLAYENGLFFYNAAWMQGYGGRVFDEKLNPVLDSPGNVKGLEFARDLLRKHRIMPEEISNTLVTTLFNEEKVAMVISGPWFRAEIKEGLDYGVALLPVIPETGRRATPLMSVEGVLLSAESAHPREAYRVIEYLTSRDAAVVMATVGKQPVVNLEAYEDPRVSGDPFLPVFMEQSKYAIPTPNIPEMRMVWTPMDIAIGKVLNGRATPAEALAEAQQKLLKDVRRYRGE